jgi:hypothetical protein
MAHAYQVRIKDAAGAVVAMLVSWRSLTYTLRVNASGEHQLVLNGNDPALADLDTDYQIEVWRSHTDPAGPIIPWYLDYEGFHRTALEQTSESGLQTYTSYGQSYDYLIEGRNVLYQAGTAGAEKSGPGETVIKEYVDENAGPGATAPPRLFDGVFTGLAVQPSGGAGLAWSGSRAYRDLMDVLQEIGHATEVDFKVVGTGPATFEFRAKAYPWGSDRSTAGLVPATGLNAAGNAPVIFSLAFGNMAAATLSRNRTQEANAIIVLGAGVESAREVIQRTDGAAIAVSPWNRREATHNASQESTTAALEAAGDAALHEMGARETLSFSVLQNDSAMYGRDYFLGDIVTARYKDIERNLQIIAVTVNVAEGHERITVEVRNASA